MAVRSARRSLALGHTGWRPAAALSVIAALCAACALSACRGTSDDGRPALCLPPLFDGGQRLHPLPIPSVFWLELLMRQHEICWYQPPHPDELRIELGGSSGVYGHPLPIEQTFGYLLNQHFAQRDLPAHLFNLAFVFPYQLRDAVIFAASERYRPDLIVYPVTLAEFVHVAPAIFPPPLVNFFASNTDQLAPLVDHPPPGLDGPLEIYRPIVAAARGERFWLNRFRELGLFVRVAAQQYAERLSQWLAPHPVRPQPQVKRQTDYDCQASQKILRRQFPDWQEWNILGYLEQLERTTGVEVLIVNWPIAHEPVGDCYNVRFTDALVNEFNRWLREQATERGLLYLDLHDFLPADEFIDSLHVTPHGHQRIAARMAETLDPLIAAVYERKHAAAPQQAAR